MPFDIRPLPNLEAKIAELKAEEDIFENAVKMRKAFEDFGKEVYGGSRSYRICYPAISGENVIIESLIAQIPVYGYTPPISQSKQIDFFTNSLIPSNNVHLDEEFIKTIRIVNQDNKPLVKLVATDTLTEGLLDHESVQFLPLPTPSHLDLRVVVDGSGGSQEFVLTLNGQNFLITPYGAARRLVRLSTSVAGTLGEILTQPGLGAIPGSDNAGNT
jgi:hypothetical protein